MVSSYKEQFRQLSIWGIVIFILVSAINVLSAPFVLNRPFMSNIIIIDTETVSYTHLTLPTT